MGNICSVKKEKQTNLYMDNINLIEENINNKNQILYTFNGILYVNNKYIGNVVVQFYEDYLYIVNTKSDYNYKKNISYYKIPQWKCLNKKNQKFWEIEEINNNKKQIIYRFVIDFEPTIITTNILNIINKHMEFIELY